MVDAALQHFRCQASVLILDARRQGLSSCRSMVLEELYHQAQDYVLSENNSVVGSSPAR